MYTYSYEYTQTHQNNNKTPQHPSPYTHTETPQISLYILTEMFFYGKSCLFVCFGVVLAIEPKGPYLY